MAEITSSLAESLIFGVELNVATTLFHVNITPFPSVHFMLSSLFYDCLQFVGGMREYVDYNMLSPGGAWAPDRRLTSARPDASHFSSSFLLLCRFGHLICEGDPGHLLGHRSKKTEDPKMEGDPA